MGAEIDQGFPGSDRWMENMYRAALIGMVGAQGLEPRTSCV
jgi:hypothetical protein